MKTLLKVQATCLLLCMSVAPVYAQTAGANSGSTSGSNSGASANTRSSSTAQSGISSVTVSIANTTSSSTPATGTQASTSGTGTAAAAGTTGSSDPSISYSGTQTIRTNPAIAAPALTTTLSDTCMGSVSLGLSLAGFGATGGTTMVDQACVRRLDAREFRAMGLTDVALALLCQSDANRRAVEATGHLCPGTTAPLARRGQAEATPGLTDDEKYRDPIVRARLGLSPIETTKVGAASVEPVSSNAKSLDTTTASITSAAPINQNPIPNTLVEDMGNRTSTRQ